MKHLIVVLILTFFGFISHAQIQMHAVNSSGGDIAKLESNSGYPQLVWSNDHGDVAKAGLELSTNMAEPDDDNFLIQGLKPFSKIKLQVGSLTGTGLVTLNPTSPGGEFAGAYMGINTQSPTAPLTVNAILGGEAAVLRSNGGRPRLWLQFSPETDNKALIGFNDPDFTDDFRIVKHNDIGNYMQFATNDINRMAISDFGQVYIGDVRACANLAASPAKLTVDGEIRSSSSIIASAFTCTSDLRFKKDIAKIADPLQKLSQLNGCHYNWRVGEINGYDFTEEAQIGLIAQEVEAVFPELVKTGHDGYKSVDYNSMTAVLVEAIKKQQEEIEGLKVLVVQLVKAK